MIKDFVEENGRFPKKTQEKKLKTQGKISMPRRTCPLPPSQVMLKKAWCTRISPFTIFVLI